MYADFFGLREPPFNITPDPRFLYLNDCYQEALAALSYGVDGRKGFLSLVGEAGTGKTTLLRRLLDSVSPSTRTVLLINPTVTFDEILEHILVELGVSPGGEGKLVLLQRLNEFLLEHTRAGGNVALLIDEAQDLSPEVLEELRLLSNLETAHEKILQIILAGQPELETMLADARLRQLRQRVTLRIRLRPLSFGEVAAYVHNRLERAGAPTGEVFTATALARVAQLTGGIPRVVNVLCDGALLTAFAAGSRQVTPAIVDDAWRDYVGGVEVAVSPAAIAAPAIVSVASEPVAAVPPAPPPPMSAPADLPPVVATDDAPAPPEAEVEAPSEPQHVPSQDEGRSAPFGLPIAAATVAILAVMLSLVSLLQNRVADDSDARAPVPSADVAIAPVDATAAERPVDPTAALTPDEATAVVDEFRAAYEARDVDRLEQLFADDASANGVRGRDAIATAYRASLATLSDVHYTMPRFWVEPRGQGADVRAPFVITYRTSDGTPGEIHGQAEWGLERRDGHPRIVVLDYRLEPQG
jgi:general secretion pathway protein A